MNLTIGTFALVMVLLFPFLASEHATNAFDGFLSSALGFVSTGQNLPLSGVRFSGTEWRKFCTSNFEAMLFYVLANYFPFAHIMDSI